MMSLRRAAPLVSTSTLPWSVAQRSVRCGASASPKQCPVQNAAAVLPLAVAARRGRRGSCPGITRRAAATEVATAAKFRILVPIADDSEEIETACITDVLTRAGAVVLVASVTGTHQVRMSRGLKVVADALLCDCLGQHWDVIACPGGMPGAERLRDCQDLTTLLKEQNKAGRWAAAVCASPAVVFATHGISEGKRSTSYPAPQFKMALVGNAWTESEAVVDGNVITSQGPGTSLQFALKIVEVLYGRPKAEELAKQLITHLA